MLCLLVAQLKEQILSVSHTHEASYQSVAMSYHSLITVEPWRAGAPKHKKIVAQPIYEFNLNIV